MKTPQRWTDSLKIIVLLAKTILKLQRKIKNKSSLNRGSSSCARRKCIFRRSVICTLSLLLVASGARCSSPRANWILQHHVSVAFYFSLPKLERVGCNHPQHTIQLHTQEKVSLLTRECVRGVPSVYTFTHTRLDEWSVTWKAICAAAACEAGSTGGRW